VETGSLPRQPCASAPQLALGASDNSKFSIAPRRDLRCAGAKRRFRRSNRAARQFAQRRRAHHSRISLGVRDNGLGIREEDQAAIFDRFFRAHSHLDGEHGVTGSGLGLAIVWECVQALGGSIRCESTVGAGTTFFISLPCGTGGDLPA